MGHRVNFQAARLLIPIIIVGAWIPAVPWGVALVGISVITILGGVVRSVTRIPTRTIPPTVSPPGPTIIPIIVVSVAPPVSPIIVVIAITIMVVPIIPIIMGMPTIPVTMTPVTVPMPMVR